MLTAFVENNRIKREVIVNKTKIMIFAYAMKHKNPLYGFYGPL